jgi:uncharacterized protein
MREARMMLRLGGSSHVARPDEDAFGDALTAPFWEAARRRRLVVQRCVSCGRHQFYPRPFCLSCDRDDSLEWVEASGSGTVYSVVTVHMPVLDELPPPYQVAIVELTEGPRLTSNIVGAAVAIGERVQVAWRARPDPFPPVPVFERFEEE